MSCIWGGLTAGRSPLAVSSRQHVSTKDTWPATLPNSGRWYIFGHDLGSFLSHFGATITQQCQRPMRTSLLTVEVVGCFLSFYVCQNKGTASSGGRGVSNCTTNRMSMPSPSLLQSDLVPDHGEGRACHPSRTRKQGFGNNIGTARCATPHFKYSPPRRPLRSYARTSTRVRNSVRRRSGRDGLLQSAFLVDRHQTAASLHNAPTATKHISFALSSSSP